MCSSDEQLDSLLAMALFYQQDFYELLPDWTVYKRNKLKYLKENIGYAIFGPRKLSKNSTLNNTAGDKDIIDLSYYEYNQQQIINKIVDQILTYSWVQEDNIRCGIIYLILIDNKSVQYEGQPSTEFVALPFFKILNIDSTTWYIDVKGRIYKSWENFLTTNDLPECIMVYPKDGYYQPDPAFQITSNSSFVWVIAKDSYACCSRAKTYSFANTAMHTIGTGASIALGIASMCTPLAPFTAAAGIATVGLSGIWTLSTSAMDLYDKAAHCESINPFNSKSALSSWLGIVGCIIGLTATGSSLYIGRAVRLGESVSGAAKTIHNTALIGSISINLIGLGYQGYNIYDKYKQTKSWDIQDIFYFGTHLMFFMNSVINIKFANDIIEITQGNILKCYEESLRDNNMRKRYNNMQHEIAKSTTNKIEQNAAIIRYINKFDTSNISEVQVMSNSGQNLGNTLMIEQYKLKFNGITLIDPLLFIADFTKLYMCRLLTNTSEESETSNSTNQSRALEKILEKLLGDFYTSPDCPRDMRFYGVPDFKVIINELKMVKNAKDILPFIFNIGLMLTKQSNIYVYLIEGCRFVWEYIKSNMQGAGFTVPAECNTIYETFAKHLNIVVEALFNAMDSLIYRFCNALQQYIKLTTRSLHNSRV